MLSLLVLSRKYLLNILSFFKTWKHFSTTTINIWKRISLGFRHFTSFTIFILTVLFLPVCSRFSENGSYQQHQQTSNKKQIEHKKYVQINILAEVLKIVQFSKIFYKPKFECLKYTNRLPCHLSQSFHLGS